jgi:hypothetical protein
VRQPLFVGGELNQKPVLRFDGFDDKLGFTGSTPMHEFTLFMVVKNYSGGGEHNSHVINFGPSGGDANQQFSVLWGGFDRVPDLILFGNGNGGMFASAPNIAANGEWRIISIVFQTRFNTTLRWNGNNATMSVNEPGPSFFGPMGDSTGSGGGIAGADAVPNLLTAKCDFAEAIVYNTVLTDSQRFAIERYLDMKYDIATGVSVLPPSIDFGTILFAESDTVTAIISNVRLDPLAVNSITNISPEFTLLNLPSFPAMIPAGGLLQFRAAFHPSVQGVSWDTIRIVTNDSLHQLARITLRGKGISTIGSARVGVLYATSGALPEGSLYTVHPSTGAISTIGSLGTSEIHGMAIRHADNVIYGSYDSPTATTLYRISSESGDVVQTRVIPVGNLHAIAFSPGDTLYGATTAGSLYRIDLNSGHADLVGAVPALTYFGLSFRPGLNELWASVHYPMDSIFTLNVATGAATFVGVTGFNASTNSLAFDPGGRLLGLIDNGSGDDYLASIDTISASGSIIAGPLSVSNLQAIAMRTDSVATTVAESYTGNIPHSYSLSQNYPNPFNPSTKIRYQLPATSHVTLKVYDVLGREVATLVNEVKEPGTYTVTWDASGVGSGVYFYRLQCGSATETRPMILLR